MNSKFPKKIGVTRIPGQERREGVKPDQGKGTSIIMIDLGIPI